MKNSQLKTYLDNLAPKITEEQQNLLDSPIFVLSAPRSGSTLLMEILSVGHQLVTIGRESNVIYKEFEHLHADYNNFESGCLTSKHADKNTIKYIRLMYFALMQDCNGNYLVNKSSVNKAKPYCFIEKTPRNALNIPFLLEIFPQARFLVLFRNPENTISSLIEAWEYSENSNKFISYKNLPGWHLPYWCFLLPINWQKMIGKSIAEICAFQWQSTYENILKDLKEVANNKIICIQFESIIKDPEKNINKFLNYFEIGTDKHISTLIKKPLKPSGSTLSKPAKDKWRVNKDAILPLLEKTSKTLSKLIELSQYNK
jgi:hypothetical protein